MTVIVLTQVADIPSMHIEGREIRAYLAEIMYAAQRHMGAGMAVSRGGNLYTEYLRSPRGSRGPNRPIFPIGPRTPHKASAPGQYPAIDNGRLSGQTASNRGAVDVTGAKPRWRAVWGTPTPYSKWLFPADEGGEVRGPKRLGMRHAVDSVINDVPLPENLVRFGR